MYNLVIDVFNFTMNILFTFIRPSRMSDFSVSIPPLCRKYVYMDDLTRKTGEVWIHQGMSYAITYSITHILFVIYLGDREVIEHFVFNYSGVFQTLTLLLTCHY